MRPYSKYEGTRTPVMETGLKRRKGVKTQRLAQFRGTTSRLIIEVSTSLTINETSRPSVAQDDAYVLSQNVVKDELLPRLQLANSCSSIILAHYI